MKHMRKLLAMVLAVMMVMSLATTAFADGTITNGTDRTYDAYQIFTGTQATNSVVLGDVAWGTGINSAAFLNALKALQVDGAAPFADCTDAASVAAVLAGKEDNAAIAKAFANLAEQHVTTTKTNVAANATATLPAGYYLLVDTSTGNETQNPALLQVTNDGDLDITVKTPGAPTPDKTIKGEGEAATANIGDTVTFVLTATMPSDLDGYDSYKLVFHDTLSKGLTYNNDATVSVEGFTTTYTVNDDGTTTITISNDNVLDNGVKAGNTITVEYTATLDADAVTGTAGNPNKVHLEYSNDPNDESKTKTTTEDIVTVFTFKLDVTKVDGQAPDTKLADAQFVLLSSDGTKVATFANGKLSGWVAVPTAADDGTIAWDSTSVLTSDANGLFKVDGLKDGTYKLKEIKAPAGYNLLSDPVDIVITATVTDTEDTQSLDALTIKVGSEAAATGDTATGTVAATIKNNAGATLPETGGMGTTLFYVFGGIMMAAAVVLLVTKKRMADAE